MPAAPPRTTTARLPGAQPAALAPVPRTNTTSRAIAAALRPPEEPPPPPPMKGPSRLWGLLVIVPMGLVIGGYLAMPSDAAAPPPAPAPSKAQANDGTNPHRPSLPEEDSEYVDRANGVGWSDKCATHVKAGKWGWAKAECDEGLKLHPADAETKANLLYDEGLIAKAAGDLKEARRDFTLSLVAHENRHARAALDGL